MSEGTDFDTSPYTPVRFPRFLSLSLFDSFSVSVKSFHGCSTITWREHPRQTKSLPVLVAQWKTCFLCAIIRPSCLQERLSQGLLETNLHVDGFLQPLNRAGSIYFIIKSRSKKVVSVAYLSHRRRLIKSIPLLSHFWPNHKFQPHCCTRGKSWALQRRSVPNLQKSTECLWKIFWLTFLSKYIPHKLVLLLDSFNCKSAKPARSAASVHFSTWSVLNHEVPWSTLHGTDAWYIRVLMRCNSSWNCGWTCF